MPSLYRVFFIGLGIISVDSVSISVSKCFFTEFFLFFTGFFKALMSIERIWVGFDLVLSAGNRFY